MRRNTLFILYLILGVYLVNMGFKFTGNLLNFLNFLDKWVLLASAILILVEGFRHLRRYY